MTLDLIKMLIVDDHPAMVEGYKSIFSFSDWHEKMVVDSAYDCESAHRLITDGGMRYNVALLDIILPPFESEQLFSGEDLAMLIKNHMPSCKVIMLTSHADSFTLYSLIKRVNPEGVLVKSDFKPDELLLAFGQVLQGATYYSATVKQSLKTMYAKEIYLDTFNRRIITLLAKGIKTKNLPQHLNLSMSAIDKRKAQIKEIFNIDKGTDEDIIREAKSNGFI